MIILVFFIYTEELQGEDYTLHGSSCFHCKATERQGVAAFMAIWVFRTLFQEMDINTLVMGHENSQLYKHGRN